MDSIFKISRSGTYGITVDGLETDSSEYLVEGTDILISTRNYAYSQTVTINVISYLNSSGTETFETYEVNNHSLPLDTQEFLLSKDGLYKISHIILPTQVWLQYVLGRDPNALSAYNLIYYYNTTDSKFYLYANNNSTEVQLTTILSAPYVDSVLPEDKVSTVIRADKNTFIMYYLNDCFGKLSKELLVSLQSNCNINDSSYKQKIFNRDVLWMGINVIKYSLAVSQYYEAQRILEDLTRCGNLCDTSLINPTYGCGCNN